MTHTCPHQDKETGTFVYYYGHLTYWCAQCKDYFYFDSDRNIKTVPQRECPFCKKFPTKDQHDPCIANLPDAHHACCGHGVREPYVSFAKIASQGVTLRGKEAQEYFLKCKKKNIPPFPHG